MKNENEKIKKMKNEKMKKWKMKKQYWCILLGKNIAGS